MATPTDAGVAKIKAEYLKQDHVPQLNLEYTSPEIKKAMERLADASGDEPASKRVKIKGQNKNRPREKRAPMSERLCPHLLRETECPYGDNCRFIHDVERFLKSKPPDLGDHCFSFETYGKCPYGVACRYGSRHIAADNSNVVNESLWQKTLASRGGATALTGNPLGKDLQTALRRKAYDFSRADAVLREVGERLRSGRAAAEGATKHPVEAALVEGASVCEPSAVASVESATTVPESIIVEPASIGGAAMHPSVVEQVAVEIAHPQPNAVESVSVKSGSTLPRSTTIEPASIGCAALLSNPSAVEKVPIEDAVAHPQPCAVESAPGEGASTCQEPSTVDPVPSNKPSIGSELPLIGVPAEGAGPTRRHAGAVTDEDVIRTRPVERRPLDFRGKLYLAPLTTVGNLPFRRVCKRFGADVTCGEMAVATNLLQGQQSEWALLRRHASEDVFGVQLCGSHPDAMTRCAQLLREHADADFVDINAGCPLDLVCHKGAGCTLMTRAARLETIVGGMAAALDGVPLTLKMRTGLTSEKGLAAGVARRARDWGGVALMTVHGRSRQARYTRRADWAYVGECARAAAPVPVFGCGDVLSYDDYERCVATPGVAGAMIARGALYKPWLFAEIRERRDWDISAGERLDVLRDFVAFGLEHWGSDAAGVETTRRFLLEWLSFLHRYVPVGLLEQPPQRINERPPSYVGRSDLETLMASGSCADWLTISEMLLGRTPDSFVFLPKHRANAYK
ncbi:PREDICTED: tRNA-dihydrouridine(47) synthase [NAD(P)(+)]-like [Priapulus caudatus]|uniref:tRNA-dihydrouridine(47) synthase [NAD(P)(+)] n=1 Tax=Priapulus caudatus TaxID=37621 RepID=A0ABM1EV35_PRICU|nr:PREDICTED: tRNA-dihydrouridine(47) synthase [NAD(P)(+)]-like [Priapulus caudatus]